MSYCDLLERIQNNDTNAFLEMTDRYGWSVYSAIREKHPDAAEADKIYNETMNDFYRCLAGTNSDDPLEAILCAFANRSVSEKMSSDLTLTEIQNAPPRIQLQHSVSFEDNIQPTKRKRKGFLHFISIFMILIAIILMLWYIAYLLMEMNYIPYIDLGYSWFRETIWQFLLELGC